MQRYINKIMLTATFSIVHDKNQTKAQKAGLIHFLNDFLCKYSHMRAHKNGQSINHKGHTNSHTIIHIIHHMFPRLDHQNFLVQKIGK
jgi:hypothetical protein